MSRKQLGTIVIAVELARCLTGQILDDRAIPFITGAGIPSVQGEVRNLRGDAMDIAVVLCDASGGRRLQQAEVFSDGTFHLDGVPAGSYLLRLVRLPNEVIVEQIVQMGNMGEPVILQLPAGDGPSAAATVSTDQLKHPLSRKGIKKIRTAQNYAAAGDHLKAIAELKQALKEPSAVPYAHGLLGQEYLQTRQIEPALEELEQASNLLPHDAIIHSNLGYALFLTGDSARGEQEVRRALELDRNNSASQRLLGYILKARHSNPDALR